MSSASLLPLRETPEEGLVRLTCSALKGNGYGGSWNDPASASRQALARLFALLDALPEASPGPPDSSWLNLLVDEFDRPLPAEHLVTPWLARFGAKGLGQPASFKRLLEKCLSLSMYLHPSQGGSLAEGLVAAAPKEWLALWDQPGDPEGAALIRFVLKNPAWVSLLEVLAARGIVLSMRVGGLPLACGIQTVDQWRSFLKTGGDPNTEVGPEKTPLWAYLLEKATPDSGVGPAVRKWLSAHPDRASLSTVPPAEALARHQWLDGFNDCARNRAAVVAHLQSRPDWAHTVDGYGAPAWARAVFVAPSALSWLLKHHPESVRQRDGHGRSPWQYLLQLVDAAHAPDFAEVTAVLGPDCYTDAAGRGLVLQLLDRPPPLKKARGRDDWLSPESYGWSLPPVSFGSKEAAQLAALPVSAWCGGTADQHGEAADTILSNPEPDDFHPVAVWCADVKGVASDLSPVLRGALSVALLANDLKGLFVEPGLERAINTTAARWSRLDGGTAVYTARGLAVLERFVREKGSAELRARFEHEVMPVMRARDTACELENNLLASPLARSRMRL